MTDVVKRRRAQNKVSQQNYRRSIKMRLKCLEDLEQVISKAAASATAADSGNPTKLLQDCYTPLLQLLDSQNSSSPRASEELPERETHDSPSCPAAVPQFDPVETTAPFSPPSPPFDELASNMRGSMYSVGPQGPTPPETSYNMKNHTPSSQFMSLESGSSHETATYPVIPHPQNTQAETGLDRNIISYMSPDYGNTPLHQSVLSGHISVLKILLAHGAHLDAVNGAGRTALHLACENGKEQIVQLLLEKGASVNLKDNSGMTALLLAVTSGTESIVLALLERGANIDSTFSL